MISSSLHGTFFHIFNGLMPFAVFKPTFLLLEAEDFGFLLPTDFPFVLLVNPSLERIVLSLETIFRSVLSAFDAYACSSRCCAMPKSIVSHNHYFPPWLLYVSSYGVTKDTKLNPTIVFSSKISFFQIKKFVLCRKVRFSP